MHLFKMSVWKSPSGLYQCADVSDLTNYSSRWWIPARLLGISLEDYILMINNEFNPYLIDYYPKSNLLLVYWKDEKSCTKFANFINKKAKEGKWII